MSAPVDVLADLDREISVWAGRMSTSAHLERWPQARVQHAELLAKRADLAALVQAEEDYQAAVAMANVWLERAEKELAVARSRVGGAA